MGKELVLFVVLCWCAVTQSENSITLPKCGLADVTQSGDRIVGGRDANIGEFPWQVSLKFKNLFIPPTHLCGASILNDRWILTAAHCVHKRYSRNFEIAVGITSQEEKGFNSYKVDRIKVHEQFDPETFLNDIAMIHVSKPIALSSQVNGICLPQVDQNVTGFATTTGWGATLEDGDMSSILQSADIPMIPPEKCLELFGPANYFAPQMLCAGELKGGTDSCQGDSGGPLIQQQNGRSVLIGIVSWGVGCARPEFPGVYTRVSHYVDWIQKNSV